MSKEIDWVCFGCGGPAGAVETDYENGKPSTTTVRPCGCSGPVGTMAGPEVPTIDSVRAECGS